MEHRAKSWTRRTIERLLTRGIAASMSALMRIVPMAWARWWGNTFAHVLYVITHRRQRLADRNIAAVFGDRFSAAERRAIRRTMSRCICKVFPELFKAAALTRDEIREVVPAEGTERMWAALERGKGAILVTAHFGNWEVAGARLAAEGFDIAVVARHASDAGVTAVINRARAACGMKVIHKDDLRAMLRHLRANGVLAIVADQNARANAIRLEFLGRPAWSAQGPAVLALRTGCAIVPGFCVRQPNDSLRGHVLEEIQIAPNATRDAAVAQLTQRINDIIGDQIRAHPGQWLWLHNRWKDTPPEAEPQAASPSATDREPHGSSWPD